MISIQLKPPYEFQELMKQSFLIGYRSLSLVGITGLIIGLVLTIQSRPTLTKVGYWVARVGGWIILIQSG